jgi:hypothetical protein
MLQSFDLDDLTPSFDEHNWENVASFVRLRNAKEELSPFLTESNKVLCATITYEKNGNNYFTTDKGFKKIILKKNYTSTEYEEFLNSLDFNYDCGYGGQELFGTVWFENGTWLERGEYDGSEWWKNCVVPEIPDECKK